MVTTRDAISRLERSTRAFIEILDGVSDVIWRCQPEGESWSLAHAVEHVLLTNRTVGARLQKLFESPLSPEVTRFDDAAIAASLFETAGPPPAGLAEPTGYLDTCAEGVSALVDSVGAIVGWAGKAPGDLRAFGLAHPVFGVLDGVQWMLFAAAHTENHMTQLRELRSSSEAAFLDNTNEAKQS